MPSATGPAPRIPAWKRLGLKLKNASDIPASNSPQEIFISKRKRPAGAEEVPSKKLKQISKTVAAQVSSTDNPVTPSLVRKKSVTFTPETKAEDGDSIKQLFNAWVAEQKSQDPSFPLESSNQAFDIPNPTRIEEEIGTALDEAERRVQRVKKPTKSPDKPKRKTFANTEKPSKAAKQVKPTSRPFLDYLRQYSESREKWKFNKNHQTHLLKHIFDVDAIPSDHAHLIYKYVKGLQGGVRTRLRSEALEVKIKDQEESVRGFPEDMADPEKRQKEYDAAIEAYVATMTAANASDDVGYEEGLLLGLSDSAMSKRVAKRMRSERVLAELGSSAGEAEATQIKKSDAVNGDDDSQKRLRMNDGSSQKVARKRKQRTMIADNDTR